MSVCLPCPPPGSVAVIFSAAWLCRHLVNPIKAQNTRQSFLAEWQRNLVVGFWWETYCLCQRDLLCDLLCVFLCLPGTPIITSHCLAQWNNGAGQAGTLHTAYCGIQVCAVYCTLHQTWNKIQPYNQLLWKIVMLGKSVSQLLRSLGKNMCLIVIC